MYEINDHDLRGGQEEFGMLPLTIGDILDLIAEPDGSIQFSNGRLWHLKEGIDLNAQVNIIGHLDSDSTLNAMVSDDDGSLCIMEA